MFIKNTEFILLKNLDWTFDLNKLVKFLFFFKLIPLSKPPFKELEQKLLLLMELEFCLFNSIILYIIIIIINTKIIIIYIKINFINICPFDNFFY